MLVSSLHLQHGMRIRSNRSSQTATRAPRPETERERLDAPGQDGLDGEPAMGQLLGRLRMEFRLTERETEIALLVCQGQTNTDIATSLGIRPRTIEKHLEHAFTKLRVRNRTAVTYLIQVLPQPMHRLRQHP